MSEVVIATLCSGWAGPCDGSVRSEGIAQLHDLDAPQVAVLLRPLAQIDNDSQTRARATALLGLISPEPEPET